MLGTQGLGWGACGASQILVGMTVWYGCCLTTVSNRHRQQQQPGIERGVALGVFLLVLTAEDWAHENDGPAKEDLGADVQATIAEGLRASIVNTVSLAQSYQPQGTLPHEKVLTQVLQSSVPRHWG